MMRYLLQKGLKTIIVNVLSDMMIKRIFRKGVKTFFIALVLVLSFLVGAMLLPAVPLDNQAYPMPTILNDVAEAKDIQTHESIFFAWRPIDPDHENKPIH